METINLKDLLKVAETGFFITNPENVEETEIQVKIKNFSVYKRKLLKQLLVKISLMELGLDYESVSESKRNYIKKIVGQKIDESNRKQFNSDIIRQIYLIKSVSAEIRKLKELWLPSEYFELDKNSKLKIVKGKEYIKINILEGGLTHYSFETNKVKFDSDWYSDFLIKLN